MITDTSGYPVCSGSSARGPAWRAFIAGKPSVLAGSPLPASVCLAGGSSRRLRQEYRHTDPRSTGRSVDAPGVAAVTDLAVDCVPEPAPLPAESPGVDIEGVGVVVGACSDASIAPATLCLIRSKSGSTVLISGGTNCRFVIVASFA